MNTKPLRIRRARRGGEGLVVPNQDIATTLSRLLEAQQVVQGLVVAGGENLQKIRYFWQCFLSQPPVYLRRSWLEFAISCRHFRAAF